MSVDTARRSACATPAARDRLKQIAGCPIRSKIGGIWTAWYLFGNISTVRLTLSLQRRVGENPGVNRPSQGACAEQYRCGAAMPGQREQPKAQSGPGYDRAERAAGSGARKAGGAGGGAVSGSAVYDVAAP